MKKELADYLNSTREIETIMFDEGDRFMYDLSHLPEVLERWAEYKETKKKSALKLSEIEEALEADEGGKTKVEEVQEEKDSEEATPEEVLDVGFKTKTFLGVVDEPTTFVKELAGELSCLKKAALIAFAEKLFEVIFLR
jgi:hypothetical protein